MSRPLGGRRVVVDIDELVVDGLDPSNIGPFQRALAEALHDVFAEPPDGSRGWADDVPSSSRPTLRIDGVGMADHPERLARHVAESIRDACALPSAGVTHPSGPAEGATP